MRDSACSSFIVKKAKVEFSRMWENVESWLVYAKKLSWTAQPYFLTDIIK